MYRLRFIMCHAKIRHISGCGPRAPTPQREGWVRPPTYDHGNAPDLFAEPSHPPGFEGCTELSKDYAEWEAREAERRRMAQRGNRQIGRRG